MRGARVEVHSGASSAVGRLLSVESSRRQDAKGNFVDVTDFSVMTDGGEMKNFELNPATSVRIAERDLVKHEDLDRAKSIGIGAHSSESHRGRESHTVECLYSKKSPADLPSA